MSSKSTKPGAGEKQIQRLFFALWPDENLRKQIKHHCKTLRRHGGGRPVDLGNLHITLAFLGNVDAQQRDCIEQLAGQVKSSSFELIMDTAGHWAKPHILWIGPSEMPDVIVSLATTLRDGAIECGLQMDMRPYKAHVTLMRKAAQPKEKLSIDPFVWQANSFTLVKSTTLQEGVKYEVVQEWPLL